MYEKQIKKSCAAIGTAFRHDYVDSRGRPTADFFVCIARCVGGIHGFRKMGSADLQSSIASVLSGAAPKKWALDQWFEVHIPILRRYFCQPDNSIIGVFLPRLPDQGRKEGKRFWAWHEKTERNAEIVRQLKLEATDRDALGFINCAVCRTAPGARFGVEVIEAHHILPVSEAGVRVVTLKDFLLVCPNCHSSIHAGARIRLPLGGRDAV